MAEILCLAGGALPLAAYEILNQLNIKFPKV